LNNKLFSFITIGLLLCISLKAGNQDSTNAATLLKIDDYEVAIFSENSKEFFPGKRFTPTKEEIVAAENALKSQLKELNSDKMNQSDTPVIDKNLKKYKRQYFGYINERGEKILFINCFWRKDKDESLVWLKEQIRVLDGGSYFWNVKYKIEKDTLFDLEVNSLS
jgi:hypothetical protein